MDRVSNASTSEHASNADHPKPSSQPNPKSAPSDVITSVFRARVLKKQSMNSSARRKGGWKLPALPPIDSFIALTDDD